MDNTQSGLFGGMFEDPSKLAALQLLMSGLNPFSKGNEMEPFIQAAAMKQKQSELTANRSAMELALTQAGMDPATAKALSHNPEAAKLAIQQQQLAGERSADSAIMSGLGSPSGGMPPAGAPAPAAAPPVDGTTPRGIRNNNPLNIESGPYTQSQPGYSGSDGRFAKFASADQGIAAADNLLGIYNTKHGLNTVAGIIGRWAPASDGNPVSAYAKAVSDEIGVKPTDPINMNDPAIRQKLISAMGKFENGRSIPNRPAPITAPAMAQGDDGASPLDNMPWPYGPVGATDVSAQSRTEEAKPIPPPLTSARSRGPTPEQIMEMIKRYPNASKETKTKLWDQYNKAVDDQKPTELQKDYNAVYQQNKAMGKPTESYDEWKLKNSRAGAQSITIDQKGEGEFEKEFGKDNAKRWSGYIKEGDAAKDRMGDINTLREISRSLGSQGVAANVKLVLGPYAESVGIPIDGLSDIQLWDSVTQKLAPQMRVPGSGSTSDIEFKGMLRAIGQLSNNPEAREKILDTFEAAARNDMTRSEIASKLATKEISRSDAEKALRELPDPMTGFRQWRDKNPDAYAAALKGKSSAAPSKPKTDLDVNGSLANARAYIAKNPAARDAVIQRLRENGIDPNGL